MRRLAFLFSLSLLAACGGGSDSDAGSDAAVDGAADHPDHDGGAGDVAQEGSGGDTAGDAASEGGGDSAGDAASEGGSDTAGEAATSGPGKVTIKVTDLAGASGKILLGMLYPKGGGAVVAGICVSVMADPFSTTTVMKAPKPGVDNPCDLDTADKVVDEGDYDLNLGVYMGGSTTPEQCAKAAVSVSGDTSVIVGALGACP